MFALLSPRLWLALALAVALAASHGFAYRAGKASVRADWDRDIAQRTAQALKAEQDARAKESALVAARQKVEVQYAQQKKRDAAAIAGAQSELDGLRNALAARDSQAGPDSTATPGTDGAPRLERQLLGQCATALTQLAETADGLETRIVGLQGYVRDVCLK